MATRLSRILTPIQLRAPVQIPMYRPQFVSSQIWPNNTQVSTDCGALTANTWKEIVNIQAPGVLQFLALQSGSNTSKNFALRALIDGELAIDFATNGNATHMYNGLSTCPLAMATTSTHFTPLAYPFTNLQIEVMSSVGLSAGNSLKYSLLHYLVQ